MRPFLLVSTYGGEMETQRGIIVEPDNDPIKQAFVLCRELLDDTPKKIIDYYKATKQVDVSGEPIYIPQWEGMAKRDCIRDFESGNMTALHFKFFTLGHAFDLHG